MEQSYPTPNKDYIVYIRCYTYNQEKYIEDALKGFVMQKTTFPYVALVIDDASTDQTANIIRKYEQEYPEIIKGVYLKENHYSKGKSKDPYVKPWRDKCKYEAICEGDDYWIDPLKLQKQVDFLGKNPEYAMCFHEAKIINETNIPFEYPKLENREYSSNELFKEWIVPTASILVKSEVPIKMIRDKRIINGDINIVLAAANIGKVYGMHEVMSVYRVQENGLTINRAKKDILALQMRYIDHFKLLSETYKKVQPKYYNLKIADTYINIAFIHARRKNYKLFITNIYQSLKYNNLRIFVRIINKIIK